MIERTVADHRRVLRDRIPLIDLRAPTEFAQGAFPSAINLPLLTDSERAAIGTRYKAEGQQSAIDLGHALVSGATRTARIDAWRAFVEAHPSAMLYCWRGGLRSQIAQDWLREHGVAVPRVTGGYKALRRACITAIDEFSASARLLVIGGRTGSGKTELLNTFASAFANSIDLERLANHRGSAFGAAFDPQPTPIAFENALAIAMLRAPSDSTVLIEDESRTIGRLALPDVLHAAIQAAPIAVLEVDRDERAARILREYVEAPLARGIAGDVLHARFADALDRIRRRLGGARHADARRSIADAFDSRAPIDAHLVWIRQLLEWYYDPMYDHQLTKKQSRVVVSGDARTVREYLTRSLDREPARS
jgi:tRNA 2-selenouridine synthase